METWKFGVFSNGISPQGIGTIGMLINFAVTLGLTFFFSKPGPDVEAMIDSVRQPESQKSLKITQAAPQN